MNIVPLGNHVLVMPKKAEEKKTESGIILKETAEVFKRGTLVSISPDIQKQYEPSIEGAEVLYEAGAGVPVEGGSLLMRIDSLVAIVAAD